MLTQLSPSKWNSETAAHLLNRAAFGGTPAEIEAVRAKGLERAVRELIEFKPEAAEVPPPEWAQPHDIREKRRTRREMKNNPDQRQAGMRQMRQMRLQENDEILDLRRWWVDRMMNGPAPLLEKMTLFWHGHFATSIQKSKDAYWMWLQNDTLRRNALGDFATLAKKMSRDPAMMIYLDLQQSRREHPNENWARELMELFTIGIGHYTEQDVRESARAFTGYRLDLATQQFRFAPFQHDRTNKTFMGQSGSLEGDNIIDILVRQPACAQFIGRKLWRFFVDDDPSAATVDVVAERLRAHHFEMRPVLHEIFTSQQFYSAPAMHSQIKSPVQYVIQAAKLLGAPLPSPLVTQNTMRQMGQVLFAPPNVKGWDGGKSWISTSTLLFRYNFANYLVNGSGMLPENGAAAREGKPGAGFRKPQRLAREIEREPVDVTSFAPVELREKPRELVSLLSTRLFQRQPGEKETKAFIDYLEARKPDTSDATMRGLLHLMMSTPEFQLT